MAEILLRPARRAAIAVLVAALAVGSRWASVARSSEITASDDFRDVASVVARYADEFGPERVLLVLDIDNTLLAMNQDLGSDQWFEWQKYLLDHEPRSRHLVADSFNGLLAAQGMLFELGRMHPPQPDLPRIIRRLQQRGIHTLILTSRGPEFRPATERELMRNGYNFAATELPVAGLPGGSYLPYDLENLRGDGLAEKDIAAFELEDPEPVSYENGVFLTAGQPKGAMLLTILHYADADIRAVVYADDRIHHVAYVFAAMAGRNREVTAIRYTREEPRMKRFQYGDKEDVTRRWRKLNRVLDEVFE
ncbi:MAG TPA: DUF2608 domain-containing protein [Lacipirellulaceae bacterium]